MIHESDIDLIKFTNDVLKFDIFNKVNDEEWENLSYIDVTIDVLKLDKYKEIKNEQ